MKIFIIYPNKDSYSNEFWKYHSKTLCLIIDPRDYNALTLAASASLVAALPSNISAHINISYENIKQCLIIDEVEYELKDKELEDELKSRAQISTKNANALIKQIRAGDKVAILDI